MEKGTEKKGGGAWYFVWEISPLMVYIQRKGLKNNHKLHFSNFKGKNVVTKSL